MTYTIYIDANNLSWDIIHKADKIGGMIEQVLPELISWQDLKENEIESALDFITETWGHITVDLCKEIYHGSYCDTPLERKIDLRRNTMKVKDLVDVTIRSMPVRVDTMDNETLISVGYLFFNGKCMLPNNVLDMEVKMISLSPEEKGGLLINV